MIVLIIGFGSIAKKHLAALKNIYEDAIYYALRSSDDSAPINGVINIFSLNELPLNPSFIIISNPTNLHFETIKNVISLEIPLFIEKPPLHTLHNSEHILKGLESKGTFTYVACNLRFLSCLQYLKNYLISNTSHINEINIYCGSYLPDWRPYEDYKLSYSAMEEEGGGVHLDLFHELDYCCWLFGLPNNYKAHFTRKSTLQINSNDYANYILDYTDFSASIILNYYRRDPKRTMEIIFANKTWEIDLLKNEIYCNKETIYSSKQRISDTYLDQMKYFTSQLNDAKGFDNDLKKSINILKICLGNG